MTVSQIIALDYALATVLALLIGAHVTRHLNVPVFTKFADLFTFKRKPELFDVLIRVIPLSALACSALAYNFLSVTVIVYISALYFMGKSAIHRSHTRNMRKVA